jgi:threonine synthase
VSTASPYKFPETVTPALGDVLGNPPPGIAALKNKPLLHEKIIDLQDARGIIGGVLS